MTWTLNSLQHENDTDVYEEGSQNLVIFFLFAPVSQHFFEKTMMVVLASVLPSFSNCFSLHFDMHGYPTHTESNDYGLQLSHSQSLGTSVGPELEGATKWSQQDRGT